MADSKLEDMFSDLRTMIIHERDFYEKTIAQLKIDLQLANRDLSSAIIDLATSQNIIKRLQNDLRAAEQTPANDKPVVLEQPTTGKFLTPEIIAKTVEYVNRMEVGIDIDALSIYYEITNGKMIIGQGPRRVWSNFLKSISAIQPVMTENNKQIKYHNYLGTSPMFRRIEIQE